MIIIAMLTMTVTRLVTIEILLLLLLLLLRRRRRNTANFKLRISKFGVWVKQIIKRRRWAFLAHRLIP